MAARTVKNPAAPVFSCVGQAICEYEMCQTTTSLDRMNGLTWVLHSTKNAHADSSSGGSCATNSGCPIRLSVRAPLTVSIKWRVPVPNTDVSQIKRMAVEAVIESALGQREPSVMTNTGWPSRIFSVVFIFLPQRRRGCKNGMQLIVAIPTLTQWKSRRGRDGRNQQHFQDRGPSMPTSRCLPACTHS